MPVKRGFKIALVVLVSVVVLIVISAMVAGSVIEGKVLPKIQMKISEATDGKYTLTSDEPDISLLTGSISFSNFVIAPTSTNGADEASYFLRAKEVSLEGFSIIEYLRDDNVVASSLFLRSPSVTIIKADHTGRPAPDSARAKLPAVDLPAKINDIRIAEVGLLGSTLDVLSHSNDSSSIFHAQDANIRIRNFSIGKTAARNQVFFESRAVSIETGPFIYHFPTELYTIGGQSLQCAYGDSIMTIDSLQLIPGFSKEEFSRKAGGQTSRVQAFAEKTELRHLDLRAFLEVSELEARLMTIEGLTLKIFRDNRVPIKETVKPSVQAILKDLPLSLKIDTLRTKGAAVYYEEYADGGSGKGKMFMEKLKVEVTNVNNDSTLKSPKAIKAVATGMFMGKCRYSTVIEFPMNTREEFFFCSGSIGSGDISVLNPLLEHTRNVSVKSGYCDSISYSFTARPKSSDGTMTFLYHDLEVEVLAADRVPGFKEKLKTLLANKVILKDSNPRKGEPVRTSHIEADRYPYRYFFFYMMQSVISGITPALEGEKTAKLLQKKKM